MPVGHDSGEPTRLGLLDEFRLESEGVPVGVGRAGQRLLALLALRGRPLPRSVVAATLWPETTDGHARGRLRTSLWRLGRPGRPLIECRGEQLRLAPGIQVDVTELVAYAHRLMAGEGELPGTPQEPLVRLEGELLPGWYDEWVLDDRERLRQLRLYALEAVAVRLTVNGRYGAALESALAAVRSEPLRESAHRALIGVHLAEGNVAEARRAYERLRRLLRIELGVEPSDGLRAMVYERRTSIIGRTARSAPIPHR